MSARTCEETGLGEVAAADAATVLAMSKRFLKRLLLHTTQFGPFARIWVVCNSSLF